MHKLTLLFLAAAGAMSVAFAYAQSENFSILQEWTEFTNAPNFLQQHLNSVAFRMLREREEKIQRLRTAEDWERRKREVREILQRIVGPFPERTPLNGRILETVRCRGYRIDKLIFESRPRLFVTADLFLPDSAGSRNPAIVYLSGHSEIAFRGAQTLILNLVKKGFNVLAIDPLGQGERLQYYDPGLKRSLIGGPTAEHDYFGKQCFLAGVSSARHFVWDIMRGIDYLESRPEIDSSRIGVTGNSGGGTQSAYIAAMDERVKAAAPSCYITSFRRLLEWMGPQDAEQNFIGGIASGIDHADLLEVRAPRPTLLVTTTRDGFSIQGARETFCEARRAFQALGAESNLAMVEDDYDHGYTPKNREAVYAFFQKHLNHPGDPADENVDLLMHSLEELNVTRTGQLIDSLGGETAFSINRAEAAALLEKIEGSRQNLAAHLVAVRESAEKLSGYIAPQGVSGVMFMGRYQRDTYSVEMYVMSGEGKCILPFLLMSPHGGGKHPALLYLHPKGKAAMATPGDEMEWFVKRGYAVLAPDLPGTGELGPEPNVETLYLGLQTRRSIVGIRASDIARCVQYLKTREDIDASAVAAVARQGLGVPLLHAAVFEPAIAKVALIETPVSYASVVMNRFYKVSYADMVTSALTAYDLPDLAACLAPRRLLIVNPVDQLLTPASKEVIDRDYAVLRKVFSRLGVPSNLTIMGWESYQPRDVVFGAWLKQ